MKTSCLIIMIGLAAGALMSCDQHNGGVETPDREIPELTLGQTARLLSELPLRCEQMQEVYDAVSSSSSNGYDEEYMMRDLFSSPGAGVGSEPGETKASKYARPLRDLIHEHLTASTKSGISGLDADSVIAALEQSGTQIYWPYSELWDGESLPVISFDPGSDAAVNDGFELVAAPDGSLTVRDVLVDEEMARERPVWIVNTNDDSAYTSLEKMRRQDPEWGKGGTIIVGTKSGFRSGNLAAGEAGEVRSLVLKDFKMKRQFDTWFRGASEFFVKCGSVPGFTSSTEAEMRLFMPSITDFMIVVKRNQVGQTIPFNAMLISEWTDQLESFAFLIVEDDGGTRTSWKAEAIVKVESKSYGVTMEIPFNQRDEIVWRGSLSSRYFDKYAGTPEHFGDVDVTFAIR